MEIFEVSWRFFMGVLEIFDGCWRYWMGVLEIFYAIPGDI